MVPASAVNGRTMSLLDWVASSTLTVMSSQASGRPMLPKALAFTTTGKGSCPTRATGRKTYSMVMASSPGATALSTGVSSCTARSTVMESTNGQMALDILANGDQTPQTAMDTTLARTA